MGHEPVRSKIASVILDSTRACENVIWGNPHFWNGAEPPRGIRFSERALSRREDGKTHSRRQGFNEQFHANVRSTCVTTGKDSMCLVLFAL